MSTTTGVACQCRKCGIQWYDRCQCRSCRSQADIEYTWIAQPEKGGNIPAAPPHVLQLNQGACQQLVDSWTNHVFSRGLTPVMKTVSPPPSQIVSPGWYRRRGVKCSVRLDEQPNDPDFVKKYSQACDWTNQTFIVRMALTFESFASDKKPKKSRLPNSLGMREYHHLRRLRNAVAHGNPLTDTVLVDEETHLFRSGTHGDHKCRLAIDKVLEHLWARILIYATSLENGAGQVPSIPGVVVANYDSCLTIQSFNGRGEVKLNSGDPRTEFKIGDIIGI